MLAGCVSTPADPTTSLPGLGDCLNRVEMKKLRRALARCNEVVDAGTYSFLLQGPPGRDPEWVQARYSFVYTHTGDGWRILHHHSSLQPG